ncbi:MAG: hypothetical protein D6698_15720 [Gammaproteobacteria bacterium]|nr:MAG: hypothetical protein D6698_15720 [Gammaproteobacteria bacterium]
MGLEAIFFLLFSGFSIVLSQKSDPEGHTHWVAMNDERTFAAQRDLPTVWKQPFKLGRSGKLHPSNVGRVHLSGAPDLLPFPLTKGGRRAAPLGFPDFFCYQGGWRSAPMERFEEAAEGCVWTAKGCC